MCSGTGRPRTPSGVKGETNFRAILRFGCQTSQSGRHRRATILGLGGSFATAFLLLAPSGS
eukprot:4428431-Amphidinium_carterae.1